MAGALNGSEWPPEVEFCAHSIVRLKRARSYLDNALLAAECCAQQNLTEPDWLHESQREINGLGHECDLLIGELRVWSNLTGDVGEVAVDK